MKEITIQIRDDVNELVGVIAKRKNMKKDKFLTEFVESEIVKLGYRMIFEDLEESYEREKERRGEDDN